MKRNEIDVIISIKAHYETLSKGQKRIADYVLSNSASVMLSSITILAKECETSEATIMRFLRKIGYDSYQVFRVKLAQRNKEESNSEYNSEVKILDTDTTVIQKVLATTENAIKTLGTLNTTEAYTEAVNSILHARSIYIFGAGSSTYVAGDLHHKLIRLGLNAIYYQDVHIQAIITSHMKKGDLLISISHSGETTTIIDCTKIAKNCGAHTLSITSFPKSSLANISDSVLLSCANETKFRPDAQTSRILQIVIIDIITVFLTTRLKDKGLESINSSQLAVAQLKK